jgi:hypothetical protein
VEHITIALSLHFTERSECCTGICSALLYSSVCSLMSNIHPQYLLSLDLSTTNKKELISNDIKEITNPTSLRHRLPIIIKRFLLYILTVLYPYPSSSIMSSRSLFRLSHSLHHIQLIITATPTPNRILSRHLTGNTKKMTGMYLLQLYRDTLLSSVLLMFCIVTVL